MVTILYTKILRELPKDIYSQYLDQLPKSLQDRNMKFFRWQDRHSHLFGKLLLKDSLKLLGFDDFQLAHLQYNKYNRPFLSDRFDFNISHSGEYVLCAIGENLRLGVDIQKLSPTDLSLFRKTMSTEQWNNVLNSKNSQEVFFTYWAQKESIVKADSRGLAIPFCDIHIDNGTVIYDQKKWYLEEINIDVDYCSFLATSRSVKTAKIDFVNYY